MSVVRCSSSLRSLPVAETLARARRLAPIFGISRVTEITRLDRVGLPVFVAIRPDADRHSVCVSAGKGLRPEEAEVGATMEAMELAWAEPRRARQRVPIVSAQVGDLGRLDRPLAVLDFCPIWGTLVDLDAPLLAVEAEELLGGGTALVPAEAVYHPLPAALGGARYFGTHSNGLASGNSVAEATVHALAEVIERDATSFHGVRDQARPVRDDTLPEPVRSLGERLRGLGFEQIVRYLPNPFGMPAFSAVIFDRAQPELTSPGDGLHPVREIALVRAVCETAQARLGFIHGGRDDLAEVYRRYSRLTPEDKASHFARELQHMRDGAPAIDYCDIPDHAGRAVSVDAAFALMAEALAARGLDRILRVVYTPDDHPIQVVRVIVPGLELYSKDTLRVGPRLLEHIRG